MEGRTIMDYLEDWIIFCSSHIYPYERALRAKILYSVLFEVIFMPLF
jgi:hypothetical protein